MSRQRPLHVRERPPRRERERLAIRRIDRHADSVVPDVLRRKGSHVEGHFARLLAFEPLRAKFPRAGPPAPASTPRLESYQWKRRLRLRADLQAVRRFWYSPPLRWNWSARSRASSPILKMCKAGALVIGNEILGHLVKDRLPVLLPAEDREFRDALTAFVGSRQSGSPSVTAMLPDRTYGTTACPLAVKK